MGFFGGGGGAAPANMVGATSSAAGTAGLVPAPAAGKNTRALFSDATFGEVPLTPTYKATNTLVIPPVNRGTVISAATSPADKKRYFTLMYAPVTGNIDTLKWATGGSGPTTAKNVNLAAWKCGEDGRPSDYIIGASATSGTTTNTDISISVSSTEITRGFFYISWTSDGALSPSSVRVFAPEDSGVNSQFYGVANIRDGASNSSNSFAYVCATSYDQTTHETFTIATDLQQRVLVGFEYA
jgi:hypothetical protein